MKTYHANSTFVLEIDRFRNIQVKRKRVITNNYGLLAKFIVLFFFRVYD